MSEVVQVRRCAHCQETLVPGTEHDCAAPKEKRPALEAWHRPLEAGRCEILCRAPGYHLRVSAPEEQAWEAVELFERWTGMEIQSERRPRRVHKPPAGQISMLEALDAEGSTAELSSED